MRPNQLPQMASLDDRSVSVIPNGGVNSSRLENEIDDNQLSDGLNIWYKDSLLRFRPGLIKQIEQTYGKIIDVYPKNSTTLIYKDTTTGAAKYGIFIATATTFLNFDGVTIEQCTSGYLFTLGGRLYKTYSFTSGHFVLSTISVSTVSDNTILGSNVYFISSSGFYCITPYYDVNICSRIYEVRDETENYPVPATPDVLKTDFLYPHIPTIYTNMKPSGSGDKLESRNYLTDLVQAEYFTNATDKTYKLPDAGITPLKYRMNKPGGIGNVFHDWCCIYIHYTDSSGATHVWKIDKDGTAMVDSETSITVTVDFTSGKITFSAALADAAGAEMASPNLYVIYPKTVYPYPGPVAKCTLAAWFGGSHPGEDSGDCMFASGNSDEQNAVYWSAVNDPTYWPTDSVDYIGDPSDAITAFGKCFGKLVIFKSRSVYEKGFEYSNGVQYFPTDEIRVGIGCDCPKTVQIIANRLVWVNSTGGVYTIVSTSTVSSTANIFTERNVLQISRNINKLLLYESVSDLQTAVSVDDGTYFYLFVGTHVYLWDYTTTPFISYTDDVKMQNRLAWYIWDIPKAASAAFLLGGKVWLTAPDNNYLYALDPDSALDDGSAWFDAYIKSKDFDFTAPYLLKKVYYLSLTLASKGSVTALVTLTDDYGDIEQAETLEDGGNEETITTLSYNQPTGFTKKFMVSVNRMKDDNSEFAVNQITALAKLGRKV